MPTGFDARLQAQAEALQVFFRETALQTFGAPHYRPEPGEGVGDDSSEAIAAAFSREDLAEHVKQALDPRQKGKLGDLVLNISQAELLACLERSYRLRRSSAWRRRSHVDGVARGHGHAAGIWERGLQAVIDDLIKRSSRNQPNE